MGLDMSFYKLGGVKFISPTGEIETDDKYKVEEIKYYRKFNALHGLLNDLYLKRGGSDMNGVLVHVSLFDIKLIKDLCLSKSLEPQEGLFWGSQDPISKQGYEDLHALTVELEDLDSKGWYIGYINNI